MNLGICKGNLKNYVFVRCFFQIHLLSLLSGDIIDVFLFACFLMKQNKDLHWIKGKRNQILKTSSKCLIPSRIVELSGVLKLKKHTNKNEKEMKMFQLLFYLPINKYF